MLHYGKCRLQQCEIVAHLHLLFWNEWVQVCHLDDGSLWGWAHLFYLRLIGGKFDDDFRKLVGRSSRCSERSCKNWLSVAVWLTASSAHLIQTSPGWLQAHIFHRWAQQQTVKGTKPRNIYKINGWMHPWRIILTSASHPPQKKKHSSRPSNNWPYHTSGLKHTNLEIPSEHAATRPPGHINPSSTPLVFLGTCRPPAPRGYYCVSMLVSVSVRASVCVCVCNNICFVERAPRWESGWLWHSSCGSGAAPVMLKRCNSSTL